MITEMIAQVTSPSAAELGLWLGCLAAILFIMNQGMKFFRNFREMPPPAQTYATKEELRVLREELSGVRADIGVIRHEMKGDKSEILADGVRRTDQVHVRINDLEKEVGTIPNQVIVLLKHTGALRI